MNLKVYAKSRKLTLKQANDLCKLVLGQSQATLTDDDMAKLDAAASAAAQQVAALPAAEAPEEGTPEVEISSPATDTQAQEETDTPSGTASLVNSSGNENGITPQTREVIAILGEETLKRNVAIFMTHHIQGLQRLSATHTAILDKFEQDIYHQTSATFERMTRTMEQAFSDADRIANPKTGDDEQLYQDYLSLVNDFLSSPPP